MGLECMKLLETFKIQCLTFQPCHLTFDISDLFVVELLCSHGVGDTKDQGEHWQNDLL